MTTLVTPTPRQLFLNPSTGAPASGFLLYTYLAGTTTKANTYIDSTGNTQNTNPIVLDTLGEADIWLVSGVAYKFVFSPPTDTDPPTNPIWTRDNIQASSISGSVAPWAIASGTANAITATYTPPNTSLPDGLLLGVRAASSNTATNPTFQPDSQPAYVITEMGGKALQVGQITANYELLLRFNLANTRWELVNASPVKPGWAVAGGTADALTAAYVPTNSALVDGLLLGVRATSANVTTTPTFSPDGLTAATITKEGGAALVAGDIQPLSELLLRYNLAHTRWELLNVQAATTATPTLMGGPYRNLKISYPGSAKTATVTADAITVSTSGDAAAFVIEALSATLDISSAGTVNHLDTGTAATNQLYFLYAISNRSVSGVLASLSATAPTLPSGYTYFTRIGAFFTDGSSNIIAGTQYGNRFRYAASLNLTNGSSGSVSVPTFVAVSLTGKVPTTAAGYFVYLQNNYGGSNKCDAIAAPNGSYDKFDSTTNPAPLYVDNTSAADSVSAMSVVEFPYESSSVYFASNGAGGALWCNGWVDNL